MLNRIANPSTLSCPTSCSVHSEKVEDRWSRNEKEDMKTAIDYLYDFKEKLLKLHPTVTEAIEQMLQRQRY